MSCLVWAKVSEKYAKLGIENLQDLLLYFPFRYEDFKTKQVLELEDGEKRFCLVKSLLLLASVLWF